MRKDKLIILFTVFVDVIGFGIVIPILPFYVQSFGAGAMETTLLFAVFSFCAFISSPFLGALSDRIGRRPVLIISIFSTAIGWFVFASAHSIVFLFIGRIIDGAAAGNFTTAQSYLVDISKDETERTANLGLIGATFGIGFIVGPMLGGALSTVSHAFPFWFAGGLAALNTVSAYLFLPETHHAQHRSTTTVFNPLRPLFRAATDTVLRPYYITWLLFALSFVTSQAIFALYVGQVFHFSAFQTGMLFTVNGVITTLNQTVLMRKVWKRHFSNAILELGGIALFAAGMAIMAAPLFLCFLLGMVFNATASSVLRVVVTSEVAGHAPPHAKGETIGILSSLMSAAMVVGPVIAGAAFTSHIILPYFIAVGYMGLAFLIAYPHRRELAGIPMSFGGAREPFPGGPEEESISAEEA